LASVAEDAFLPEKIMAYNVPQRRALSFIGDGEFLEFVNFNFDIVYHN